jgi:hypothetical protein
MLNLISVLELFLGKEKKTENNPVDILQSLTVLVSFRHFPIGLELLDIEFPSLMAFALKLGTGFLCVD